MRAKFAAGALIVCQGDPADRFFLVESGEVSLQKSNQEGGAIEISRIKAGQWFGEVMLFAAQAYPANAVAACETELSVFRIGELRRLMESDGAVPAFFLKLLADKCLALNRRLEELTVMPVRERFLRYLFRLCGSTGRPCPVQGPCSFSLPSKKREIATELGIVPETLSRAIRSLENEGLISVTASRVLVRDCARLRSEL